MKTIRVVLLSSALLCSALSAPLQVNEETNTMVLGEDLHIPLSSVKAEVTFRARMPARSGEVVLMKGGAVVSSRVKLNARLSHLVVDGVGKGDEGVYTVKSGEQQPELDRRITLVVRDCSFEQNVKYGDNFHIQLLGVTPPITLEYRPSAVEADQAASVPRSALVLLTSTGLARDGYQGRVSANQQHVELRAATGADEGSYTVRDAEGSIKKKVCLNVIEHQNFDVVPYAGTLKINLLLNSSVVLVYYTPDYDATVRLILDKGELTSAQEELGLEGRLSLEGSVLTLTQVKGADSGQFKVTDQLGFAVSNVYLEVQSYKLPTLYVAIIALVGLLVFLLLVCLLSCLIKVKKRAKRAAALEKIAEGAGKEDDGKAFAQVVKEITHLNEESKHSQADNTEKSQSTEVDIKGLEVSSKEVLDGANMETSDSGVEFNTTGLPLDTDTDAPDQIPDSEAVSLSFTAPVKASPPVQVETKPSAPPEVEAKPSPPPVEVKPIPVPEVKPSPPPVEVEPIPVPEAKPSPSPAEVKPVPVPEVKPSPPPETKKTPEQPAEPKLSLPKPVDTKPSPVPSPEPKPAPSPVSKPSPSDGLEAKTPEPKSTPFLAPSPKTAAPTTPGPIPISSLAPSPKATAPTTPEPKMVLTPTPTPETPKVVTPEPAPTTNGTPELAPEPNKPGLEPSPATSKATKTPEVELKSSGPAAETKGDAPPTEAGDTTTTTTT